MSFSRLTFFLFSLTFLYVSNCTFVIGHRGDSGSAPENTLPAFALALQNGAAGFETDLRTSADGFIVLIHDSTVDRTTNCSTTAPEGQCKCGPVNSLTLAALKTCDAGSYFGEQWVGTQIPTFEEAVQLARTYGATIVMDLKQDDVDKGLLGDKIEPIVTEYNMESYVIASCWTPAQIKNMDTYLKFSPKQYLGYVPPSYGDLFFEDLIASGVTGFSVSWTTTTSAFIHDAHLRLLAVYVWTVNDEADMEDALLAGVDGILTNYVDQAVTLVNEVEAALQQIVYSYRNRKH